MKFLQGRLGRIKIILSLILLFPMAAHAHLISITATTPFPATVAATSMTTATFTVTNITSRASITVIDQSSFPSSSGLSISSNTCGSLMGPGKSCTIQVLLKASGTAQTISTALKEWAKPSVDGVQFPINISITAGLPNITLVAINSSGLPALRDPVVGENAGNWLIVSG